MSAAGPMEWRRCARFPLYEVSECGDVRRGDRRVKGFIDTDGYVRYSLELAGVDRDAPQAHRLVAEAFLGPAPSPEHEVAHNNGSRLLNHHSNLRWATRAENHSDLQIHGTAQKGARNGNAKLSESDVVCIRRRYALIKNRLAVGKISDLAKEYGIHHATLIGIAKGKHWPHIPMETAR